MQRLRILSGHLVALYTTAIGIQNPLLRIRLRLAVAVVFASGMSAMLILNTMGDVRHSDLPQTRLRLRAWRLEMQRSSPRLQRKDKGRICKYAPIAKGSVGSGEPQIRLLRLLPRWPFGRILCQLVQVDLRDNLGYYAVSYHWGDADRTETVYIDGRIFPVAPTVAEVLYYLSSYWRSQLV